MKHHGFEQVGKSISLDPEYVKLQRASEVKKYHEAVESAQEELKALQKRIREIHGEISVAYAKRAQELDTKESAIKFAEDKLREDRKHHEMRMKELENDRALLDLDRAGVQAQAEAQAKAVESSRSHVLDLQAKVEAGTKRVDDYGLRVANAEEALNKAKAEFEAEQAKFYEWRAVQEASIAKDKADLQALMAKSSNVVVHLSENKAVLEQLEASRAAIAREKVELTQAISDSRAEFARAQQALRELETTRSEQTHEASRLQALAKKLDEDRRVMEAEYALKNQSTGGQQ